MKTNVTIPVAGRARNDEIRIALCDTTIERLFDEAFAGWCLACRHYRVDAGELICCACLAEAIKKHRAADCCYLKDNDEQSLTEQERDK